MVLSSETTIFRAFDPCVFERPIRPFRLRSPSPVWLDVNRRTLYVVSVLAQVWPYYVTEPRLIRGVNVPVVARTGLLLVGPILESTDLAPETLWALRLLTQMPSEQCTLYASFINGPVRPQSVVQFHVPIRSILVHDLLQDCLQDFVRALR